MLVALARTAPLRCFAGGNFSFVFVFVVLERGTGSRQDVSPRGLVDLWVDDTCFASILRHVQLGVSGRLGLSCLFVAQRAQR